MSGSESPVPVIIVTGFLGSGKTTMINFLLGEVGGKEKLAIVKNEIGDIAVDSKIIKGKNIIMKELLNGCVCCTLVGDLEDSLKELVDTVRPDRIIIEASGAANPAILAVNIDRMDFVKRDLIVTVIDALNFGGYKDKTIVGRLQQKFNDLVVINRVGDVSEETLEDVLDEVYELRPGIPVVKTTTGRVHPDVLFGIRGDVKRVELADIGEKELHGEHLHEDEIETFSFRTDNSVKKDCFEAVLDGLSEEYYRIKGFIKLLGSDEMYLVNFVCGRHEIEEVENGIDEEGSRVVFIGRGILKYKDPVLGRLKKCEEES